MIILLAETFAWEALAWLIGAAAITIPLLVLGRSWRRKRE